MCTSCAVSLDSDSEIQNMGSGFTTIHALLCSHLWRSLGAWRSLPGTGAQAYCLGVLFLDPVLPSGLWDDALSCRGSRWQAYMHPRTYVSLAPAQLGENELLLGGREAGRLLSAQGGQTVAWSGHAPWVLSMTVGKLMHHCHLGGAQVSEQTWSIHLLLTISLHYCRDS